MAPHLRTAVAASGAATLAYVLYREIRHLATRPQKIEALGRVGGRWQRADLDRMVRCDPKRLRRMLRALLLGAPLEGVSDERLRRAFRYAERPDDASKSTAPVDRYVALARSCSLALDEPGDSGSGRGEPELGPDPPFSLPLPRVVAWTLRVLAPGVARASDAWLAARRLRRVVRCGVVWLERRGTGTPWLVLHGVAGLFCSQYDALARALGDDRPVRVPLHPNLGDATDFASDSDLSIAGFALSIAAALDGGPVDVLAVSIGTSVAAALMRHGQVRRAIYVDPVAFAPCGADAWRLFFERPLCVARILRRRRLRLAGQRKPYPFEHEARAFVGVPPAAVVDVLYALMCCSDVVRVVCRVHSYGRCTEACLPPLVDERPPTLVLVDEDDALTCAAEHVDHFEAFPRTTVVRARGFHGSWLLNPQLVTAVASWTAQVDADEAAVDAILAPAKFGAR